MSMHVTLAGLLYALMLLIMAAAALLWWIWPVDRNGKRITWDEFAELMHDISKLPSHPEVDRLMTGLVCALLASVAFIASWGR